MVIRQTNFKYNKPLNKLDLSKVFFIILHHIKANRATPAIIHEWHKNFGFHGFGYNEYIQKDGTVWIGRGDHIGAQTSGMNSKSYGIGLEGDFSYENQMTTAQFDSLLKRIRYHQRRMPNDVKVKLHNEFQDTECPGTYFPTYQIMTALETVPEVDELKLRIEKLQNEVARLENLEKHQDSIITKTRRQYKEMRRFYQEQLDENRLLKEKITQLQEASY